MIRFIGQVKDIVKTPKDGGGYMMKVIMTEEYKEQADFIFANCPVEKNIVFVMGNEPEGSK